VKSPNASLVFTIPKNMGSKKILSEIAGRFLMRTSPQRSLHLHYYETFDWRLYDEGLALLHDGQEYRLANLQTEAVVLSCRAPSGARFWWDFPQGTFQDRLRGILEERAVLPLGEIEVRVRNGVVMNSDDKTVARLCIEEGRGRNTKQDTGKIRTVKIVPVRGYVKEMLALSLFLQKAGLSPTAESIVQIIAQANGRKPGDYTSKLKLRLEHSMTAQEAAGAIYRYLLDIIERNVHGIREDIDTEFLHDFRVAVRRTRSALSQIKGILPKEVSDPYGAEFAQVGRSTNRLRDLDVYLLSGDRYRAMLSEDLASALDPLFDELAAERKREHRAVVRMLSGRRYRDLVKNWKKTLDAFGSTALDAKRAEAPVMKVAERMIARRYARVMTAGGRIDDQSPDTDLHQLRISCKKLRYLLEFFASLHPPDKTGQLIKQLKKLQDNLGEFNDLSVQQTDLKSFLDKPDAQRSAVSSAAIGALIAKLENRQKEVRREFAGVFQAFASSNNVDRFRKLFHIK
jgi:CHAD domain-containing protein